MIAFFSRTMLPYFRSAAVVTIVVAVRAWKPFGWCSLFWAEWRSLAGIGVHYILDSTAGIPYETARGAAPATEA